jgi:hypothetical protein
MSTIVKLKSNGDVHVICQRISRERNFSLIVEYAQLKFHLTGQTRTFARAAIITSSTQAGYVYSHPEKRSFQPYAKLIKIV